jgi:tetratricopeptide (TPR) repeat protein
MIKSLRIVTTVSALAIAATVTGCAIGPHNRQMLGTTSGHIGLATQAQVALEAKQYATAVSLAEQAVQYTPDDAGFRMLLGNCYFAAGRFASAETAYRDSLSLLPNQPEVVLKLALVQIAQGKNAEALGYLNLARDSLDPADYGLAVALAGRPVDAIQVLEAAARAPGADSRVRQNLAMAYGLAGEWTEARTIAAQDLAPNLLEPRIQQWMQLAKPTRPSDQIAAVTGIQPAADPGEPQRLALKGIQNPLERLAQAATQQAEQTTSVLLPDPAPAAPAALAIPQPTAAPQPAPQTAEAAPAPQAAPEPIAAPEVAEAAKGLVQPATAPIAPPLPTTFDAPPPSYVAITDRVRKAAAKARSEGNSNAVVQLGAYSSPKAVETAWNMIAHRYSSLATYEPVSARFQSSRGTVYRLSIKGFASAGQAQHLCSTLRENGANCFVRSVAGDSPVQFASR